MTIIKLLKPLRVLVLALALFSCNNSGSSNTDAAKTDSTATTDSTPPAATTAMPAMAAPFDVAEVYHKVKDYAAWKHVYEADSSNRTGAGLENIAIGRNMSDSNEILLVFKTTDVAKARTFSTDPKLKEVMHKGGVISKPEFSLWHVIRFNPDSHEKQWVEITHKVKDFAVWLKVYDGEGTAQRATEGVVDVALARDIDDSNRVKLVFDVTDLAKAKAAISSDAKKKLMMSAGVEGKPAVVFYTAGK